MKFKIIAVLFLLVCISCTTNEQTKTSILDYIPSNTTTLLKINDYNSLTSEIKNNDFLTDLKKK